MRSVKEDKQTILYTSSFGSLKGGGQRSTRLLIKYLDKSKFAPVLLVPEEDELSQAVRDLGVKVLVMPFPRLLSVNVFAMVRTFVLLKAVVKTERVNLIHTDSPRQTLYLGVIGKLLRVPVVMHLRVSESGVWLDRILYWLTDIFIAVSKAVTGRFSFVKNANKIRVVHNAVEVHEYTPVVHRRRKQLFVAYFGRIHPGKGIETLINASKALGGTVPVIIMGDGEADYVSHLRNLASGATIQFNNYKPDIRKDIANTDVVVLPSVKGEGLSRIIIEAMAMGKTVVASDQPSNIEALGEELKEYIFPSGNEKKLAEILNKIAFDRNMLRDVSTVCRKRAEHCFDIRRNTKKIEEIYDTLLITHPS